MNDLPINHARELSPNKYSYEQRKQREATKDLEELRNRVSLFFQNGEHIPEEITSKYNDIIEKLEMYQQKPTTEKIIIINKSIQNIKLFVQKKLKEMQRNTQDLIRNHRESPTFRAYLFEDNQRRILVNRREQNRVGERQQRSLDTHLARMIKAREQSQVEQRSNLQINEMRIRSHSHRNTPRNQQWEIPLNAPITTTKNIPYQDLVFTTKEKMLTLPEKGILNRAKINYAHMRVQLQNEKIPDIGQLNYFDINSVFKRYEKVLEHKGKLHSQKNIIRTAKTRLEEIFSDVSSAKAGARPFNEQQYDIYKVIKRIFLNLINREKAIVQLQINKTSCEEIRKQNDALNDKIETYLSELTYGTEGCNDRLINTVREIDHLEFGSQRTVVKEQLPLDEKILYYLRDLRDSLFETTARSVIQKYRQQYFRKFRKNIDQASTMEHLKWKLKDSLHLSNVGTATFGHLVERDYDIKKLIKEIKILFSRNYTPQTITKYLKENISANSYQTIQKWFTDRFNEEAISIGPKIFDAIEMEVSDESWAHILREHNIIEY